MCHTSSHTLPWAHSRRLPVFNFSLWEHERKGSQPSYHCFCSANSLRLKCKSPVQSSRSITVEHPYGLMPLVPPTEQNRSYKHKLTKHLMEILLMHDVLTRVSQRFASTNDSRSLNTEWEGRISLSFEGLSCPTGLWDSRVHLDSTWARHWTTHAVKMVYLQKSPGASWNFLVDLKQLLQVRAPNTNI